MRTDFNASEVAPWGARSRAAAARCRSCGSTLNRWVMGGFPGKRWELDCCRGGRSGAVLKGAGAVGRIDIVLPRGWDSSRLREETLRLRPAGEPANWEPLPQKEYESTASRAGILAPQPGLAQPTGIEKAATRGAKEPEPEPAEDEPFGLLPTYPFAEE